MRLLVVSNRLPITLSRNPDNGLWSYSRSSGGLVAALGGLQKTRSFLWIGWPGLEVAKEEREQVAHDLMEQYQCVPVWLSDTLADLHYNGYSNSVLWPLFHYLPGEVDYDPSKWEGYRQANLQFSEAIRSLASPDDLIWIHDYHLMLLPQMLRDSLGGQVRLGWFLHTPFPASEIYRGLPQRKEILQGLLACDLVGFHTHDYARHFLSSCQRLLPVSMLGDGEGLKYGAQRVMVGTFPVGIDPIPWQVCEEASEETRQMMVGVDRLDYIKGVPHKLHAFERLLEQHPEHRGKVVLLQVAVPTRSEVPEYQALQQAVNELVGRINGRFATVDYTPIILWHRSIPFPELVRLYRMASVCLVTSCRDGMNLVSYEYVACRPNGVLILSEFAGAAQSLNGAIIVNPWNTDELVDAYHQALTMDPVMKASNHASMLAYVTKHTASYWGSSFIQALEQTPSVPTVEAPVASEHLDEIRAIMEEYSEFTPGAKYQKDLIWDVGQCEDREFGKWQAQELKQLIEQEFKVLAELIDDQLIIRQ